MGEDPRLHDSSAERLCLFGEQAHVVPAPGAVVALRSALESRRARQARFPDQPRGRQDLQLMSPPDPGGRRPRRRRDRSGSCRCPGKDDLARLRELESSGQRLEEFIDVRSPATTEPFRKPMMSLMRSPPAPWAGKSIQPAVFHARINSRPQLLVEFAADALPSRFGHRSERIPVEIDDTIRQIEHRRSRPLKEIIDHRATSKLRKRWILLIGIFKPRPPGSVLRADICRAQCSP